MNPSPLAQPPQAAPVPGSDGVPDWKCRKEGPVSGRYEGEMTAPTAGQMLLDLRLDIDPRSVSSPVMNRISGDLYQLQRITVPGRQLTTWRVYRESWVVDAPVVTWERCLVTIRGTVRFWRGIHPQTTVEVRVPWAAANPVGPATVTFAQAGGMTASYTCGKKSDAFRELTLELAVLKSVNDATPFRMPVYDTHSHPTRPVDLRQRTLTLEQCYLDAGTRVTIRAPGPTIIDDSAPPGQPPHSGWTDAQLHDVMAKYFTQFGSNWPNWQMWGFLANTYQQAGVGGIMFDASIIPNSSRKPNEPDRRGFAVFRDHEWFKNLPASAPTTDAQSEAVRKFLYTWVHEAGHAFNFLHSWDKNRPDALSWMNYDWRYDQRNGPNKFWSDFRFRFDDEELIHLRHGDRPSVMMGGDPWSSGGHAEAPAAAEYLDTPPGAMSAPEGAYPLELTLRSQGYFEFMEPVSIELRLRNVLPDLPLSLDTELDPALGGVIIHIRRPDGRIVEYSPLLCKLATTTPHILKPAPAVQGTQTGEDRYSQEVFLSYGKYGFYFDDPGEYLVRALYQGAGDVLIPSNSLRLRVGHPLHKDQDRLAQDFFSDQVGVNLYLHGSRSASLKTGTEVLQKIADQTEETALQAKVSAVLAHAAAQPLWGIRSSPTATTTSASEPPVLTLTEATAPDFKTALDLSKTALAFFKANKSPDLNLAYSRLVRQRAKYHLSTGGATQKGHAKKELASLHTDLAARNVNSAVLQKISADAQAIG